MEEKSCHGKAGEENEDVDHDVDAIVNISFGGVLLFFHPPGSLGVFDILIMTHTHRERERERERER